MDRREGASRGDAEEIVLVACQFHGVLHRTKMRRGFLEERRKGEWWRGRARRRGPREARGHRRLCKPYRSTHYLAARRLSNNIMVQRQCIP